MSAERVQFLIIKDAISKLSEEEQAKIKACEMDLKEVIARAGDIGLMALALVGAEYASQE
jgi:hypothetical protein